MSIHLYRHNEDAYQAAERMLDEKGMAAVIHPTGSGKSMIAFKLAERHSESHFLWLSPSEYIYQTQLENTGLAFPNIAYMSYSRLMKNEDCIETLHPDYIILDEFHRCGATEWGRSVKKLLDTYPEAKRLGLSATNIRYLDNQRNMAVEIFEGNIASEMTLGEAIIRGILPEPKYVIAMYSYKKELDQLKKRIKNLSNKGLIEENQKLLEQLRRALEQADGLDDVFAKHMSKKSGKYILFCSSKEHISDEITMGKLADYHLGRLIQCISETVGNKSLTKEEKDRELKHIIEDDYTRFAVEHQSGNSKKIQLLSIPIKIKNVSMCYCVGKTVNWFRASFPALFSTMRAEMAQHAEKVR